MELAVQFTDIPSKRYENPTEQEIQESLSHSSLDFASLGVDDNTYIHFSRYFEDDGRLVYELGYQDGSTRRAYGANQDVSVALAIAAFIWYLRGDDSWRTKIAWIS